MKMTMGELVKEGWRSMASAKKCDICGKLYEEYNFKKSLEDYNGFMLLNIDSQGSYFRGPVCDCCPECMNSIKEFIEKLAKQGKEE